MNMMHRDSVVAVVLAVAIQFGSTASRASDGVSYNPERGKFNGGIDPAITRIEAGGYWQHAEKEGSYRIVVRKHCSPEHCFDEAYLQWIESIREEDRRHKEREYVTLRVPETGDFSVIGPVEILFSEEATAFQLHLTNSYTGERATLCIRPLEPGKYRAEPRACNPGS